MYYIYIVCVNATKVAHDVVADAVTALEAKAICVRGDYIILKVAQFSDVKTVVRDLFVLHAIVLSKDMSQIYVELADIQYSFIQALRVLKKNWQQKFSSGLFSGVLKSVKLLEIALTTRQQWRVTKMLTQVCRHSSLLPQLHTRLLKVKLI